ncbi:MAG: hypothetical protein ABFE08_01180 [Armatimonadia bacterium]
MLPYPVSTEVNMNPTRDQIDQLRRQANELAMSDSKLQRAWAADLFNKAADLEAQLTGVRPVSMTAHVSAYRDHQQAEARARVLAAAEPRLAAAHRDIERMGLGRISYSASN